jgi:hypothetical protein
VTAAWFGNTGEVRSALGAIVSDPDLGPEALSDPQRMSNVLHDLLPDAPREANILVTASSAGMPEMISADLAQGMDADTAIRLCRVWSQEFLDSLAPGHG